jgi:hypothetical protein
LEEEEEEEEEHLSVIYILPLIPLPGDCSIV